MIADGQQWEWIIGCPLVEVVSRGFAAHDEYLSFNQLYVIWMIRKCDWTAELCHHLLVEWRGFEHHVEGIASCRRTLQAMINGNFSNIRTKTRSLKGFCVVLEGAWDSLRSATLRPFMCTVHVHDCIDIVLQRSFQDKRRRADCLPPDRPTFGQTLKADPPDVGSTRPSHVIWMRIEVLTYLMKQRIILSSFAYIDSRRNLTKER